MADLSTARCSVTRTARKRFAWAVWWSGPPSERPFRKPDAHGGGFPDEAAALADAARVTGRTLIELEPYWARAWHQVMRGGEAPPRPVVGPARPPRERAAPPVSAWAQLGLLPGASLREVRAAFRARALTTHPDHGGSADEFRAVQRAYRTLVRRLGT